MTGQQEQVMADARAFMKSRVILTAAELNLFTHLDGAATTATKLAAQLDLDARATTRVLDCLAGFHLLKKEDGQYRLTDEGSLYSERHPQSILPMIRHFNHLWDLWSKLTSIVQIGMDPETKPGIQMDEEEWTSFIGAMHVVGREVSEKIARGYDLSRFRRLLDVGGASGTYTVAFLRKNPQLNAVLFDLERVIPIARERIEKEGLLDRVQLVAGDFYTDELPSGCDLTLLSAIIHQNNSEENINLYRKVWRALEPGGTILIRDYVMDESRTQPPAGALFDINMLVATRGGKTYTFSQIEQSLREVGFEQITLARAGKGMDSLVQARKPLADPEAA